MTIATALGELAGLLPYEEATVRVPLSDSPDRDLSREIWQAACRQDVTVTEKRGTGHDGRGTYLRLDGLAKDLVPFLGWLEERLRQ